MLANRLSVGVGAGRLASEMELRDQARVGPTALYFDDFILKLAKLLKLHNSLQSSIFLDKLLYSPNSG
jgi:hypothetical protein